MRPKTTGILLLLAAALGAFVYFYEIRGADARREAEEREKRLFGVEQADIEWISLTQPSGESARLERRDGRWLLVSPLEFPADTYAADNLAATLSSLASEAVLENPQPPEEYGLGPGARIVRFGAGGEEHELRIGKDAPVGGFAYASTPNTGAVYTIARFKAAGFDKPIAELRDKRILEFDVAAIQQIEASWPDGRVTLERDAAATPAPAEADDAPDAPEPQSTASWRITSPIQGRADAQTVEELLSTLSFLRADDFVDEVPSDTQAGFASPVFEIALTAPGEGEGAAPRVFRMAVGGPQGSDHRLVRAAQRSLYTSPVATLDDLPRDLAAYRWKQLAHFAVGDAAVVDFFFQAPKGDPVAIHAERGTDGWTSTPEAFAPARLESIVAELSRLRAEDIVADSMGDAELRALGLAPPNAIITVLGSPEAPAADADADAAEKPAAPVLAEVQIGDVEGSEWIAARAAGDPTVYRLPYSLAEQLPVSLDSFRNRFRASEGEEAAPGPSEDPPLDPADFLPPQEESP
jgi:hypothetical protein